MNAEPRAHPVQIHEDPRGPARGVVAFLAEGLEAGDGVAAVATPAHGRVFETGLRERGLDPERVATADAAGTLERIEEDGSRFREVVGDILDRVAEKRPGARLRVYGETVDVLWKAGRLEAVLRLEELWASLMKERPLTLLRGCRMNPLGADLDREALARARGRTALPCERLEGAVGRALTEVLGASRAADLEPMIAATIQPGAAPLRAERTVLWLRRNLPRRADEVLSLARRLYEEGA